jgi:hypothetical protein
MDTREIFVSKFLIASLPDKWRWNRRREKRKRPFNWGLGEITTLTGAYCLLMYSIFPLFDILNSLISQFSRSNLLLLSSQSQPYPHPSPSFKDKEIATIFPFIYLGYGKKFSYPSSNFVIYLCST